MNRSPNRVLRFTGTGGKIRVSADTALIVDCFSRDKYSLTRNETGGGA